MLKDRVAIITGSIGGIGFHIAEALAKNGCNIVLNGFADAAVIKQRIDHLTSAHGVAADYHGADLRKPAEMEDFVDTVLKKFGSADILVNNAAVRHFGPIEKYRTEDWDESLAVNVSAPFHMTRLVLPSMKRRNWGRIVNIASTFGFVAAAERIDYITTKTALVGMTRAVAVEVAQTGITCNAICPGTTLTPAIEGRLQGMMTNEGIDRDTAVKKVLAGKSPSGRFVDQENVAALAAFLCGPHSADFNGAALPIDAAWLAGR